MVADGDAGLMLNTALMRDGVFIEIADGVELDAHRSRSCRWPRGEAEAAIFHRSVVLVGAGAKATIVEISESAGLGRAQINGAIVFETGDESEVQHLRLVTRQRRPTVQVLSLLATVGAQAKFDSFALVCNAGDAAPAAFRALCRRA